MLITNLNEEQSLLTRLDHFTCFDSLIRTDHSAVHHSAIRLLEMILGFTMDLFLSGVSV